MASYPGYDPNKAEEDAVARRRMQEQREAQGRATQAQYSRGDEAKNQPQEAPPKVLSPHDSFELAKKQSKERREMLDRQGKARLEAKKTAKNDENDDGRRVAALREAQIKEDADLVARHKAERAEADPRGLAMPVYNGLALQEAVGALHAELTALAPEHDFEVSELRNFGLEFDVFDPVTGTLTSPARAHRRDVGDAGSLLSADAVVSDIESSRRHQASAGVTTYAVDRVA